MNRTGLMIAGAVAVLAGLVLGVWPQLDLRASGAFVGTEAQTFPWRFRPPLPFLRDAAMWLVALLVAPACLGALVKLLAPHAAFPVGARAILFLTTTIVLGPGMVANVGLKDHWGRPRPIDVVQFQGTDRFVAWWDPRGTCDKNCSFVSGDAAGAFWTYAPAALAPPAWRPAAFAAATAFGASVGLLRMMFGGHFLSDVIFAGVFMFLVVWLIHGLIYRWGRPPTDADVERNLARLLRPLHEALRRLTGGASTTDAASHQKGPDTRRDE